MSKIPDLRSDTVTRPTPAMLEAMMKAAVGDDVFREDPTVNALEERTAQLFGKEAGLFCASGVMSNQIAIKAHTQPGDEVICDRQSHIYIHESGGVGFNSSAQLRLVDGDRGRINAVQVEENINPLFDWLPRTSLVSLENTVNKAGGSYYAAGSIEPIAEVCRRYNLRLHLDGARIFNALIETKEKAHEHARPFDSISICFSKGLGCPVGSVLVGSKEYIARARRIRKVLGGGMRQAGYLAAAGLYALDHHIDRLKEDHQRARAIGRVLESAGYVEALQPVDTNIVIFTLKASWTAEAFSKKLLDLGVRGIAFNKNTVRFVTHLDFNDEDLEKTTAALKKIG